MSHLADAAIDRANRAALIAEKDAPVATAGSMDDNAPEEMKTDGGLDSDNSSTHKQDGVRRAEALTTVWDDKTMIAMFILLYMVVFTDNMLQAVQGTLSPYITSAFGQHSLLSVTNVLASIVSGVCNLAIAKVIDIWGRAEGFAVMISFITLAMILKAACNSVEMYTAGNTIYWTGHTGILYIVTIMTADMTTVKNRLIMLGIQGTTIIASNLGGPQIATLFYDHANFRWAFGAFLIIEIFFAVPVLIIFILSKRKAVKLGKYPPREPTGATSIFGAIYHYCVEFDIVGMLLTIFGFSLLLLPFSIQQYAPNGWKTGYIIAMIVLGVFCLAGFAIWEKYFAPVRYMPWRYLKDRTILLSCLLYGFMFLSIFVWDTYYYSYLIVVNDLSKANASYVLNAFSVMSAFIGPFIGLIVRYNNSYKWVSIGAFPFAIIGTALLIIFRHPGTNAGYLVMCQLFNGVSSGIWSLTAQIAIMARVSHQEVAVAIALYNLFGSIGAAISQAIAGAMWSNMLPDQLRQRLPAEVLPRLYEIYGDIDIQTSWPIGDPVRDAIIDAYGYVMRLMVIIGSAFLPLCLLCVLLWKNVDLKSLKQTVGNVF